MCEKCKPARIKLTLSVTSVGGTVTRPLTVFCSLDDVKPDHTGLVAHGMDFLVDADNAAFVRSFLAAVAQGVDEAIDRGERCERLIN